MSSQSSVIGSGLWPSIFLDLLMPQLVRALAGWAIGGFSSIPGRAVTILHTPSRLKIRTKLKIQLDT